VLAGILLLAHLALLSARIPWEPIRWLWSRLAPLLVMIVILQPLFAPGPGPALLQWGPIRLTGHGILDGISFSLRAAALAFLVATLLLTTEPTSLVRGLVKMGLPYPWGLTVGLAMRYLPTTYSLFRTIGEAQQARGWLVGQGNLIQRARSYLPILIATIIAALRLSDGLSLALAARGLGYAAKRTTLHDVAFRTVDWLAVALTGILAAGMIVLRYGLGFGSAPW
jgi:energy-coupling factor transport system permease protein